MVEHAWQDGHTRDWDNVKIIDGASYNEKIGSIGSCEHHAEETRKKNE